ncbi:hypothetical protein [Pseudobacteroides cellulosolvens]|uniref:Uncharacterized protein n=1 Tax=Pseudobacteroides cellulosolvens ATCC 35603 = DSM 2933 TaxID=398512 RepID=A0A0L6JGK0_9FIRM|nr:hypothetical protein [Pseudobacteroides cellulosolvens]KNY24834.1 hypothetical protein Bccel_0091 [Pseudobacteroides cellulosolvens ATCC 35603 = DSM 2933]
MSNYSLEVVSEPKPGTATVFVHTKKGKYSFIQGYGNDNYQCGVCKNILAEKVDRGQITSIVFKCPNCDSFNVLKGT